MALDEVDHLRVEVFNNRILGIERLKRGVKRMQFEPLFIHTKTVLDTPRTLHRHFPDIRASSGEFSVWTWVVKVMRQHTPLTL